MKAYQKRRTFRLTTWKNGDPVLEEVLMQALHQLLLVLLS